MTVLGPEHRTAMHRMEHRVLCWGRRAFSWGGGGGGLPPPPPPGGVEFLEAPKAPKNLFGLNQLAPKAPEKIFDRPKARRKIWPNYLRGGGGWWVGGSRGGGWVVWDPPPPPPPPGGAELLSGTLGRGSIEPSGRTPPPKKGSGGGTPKILLRLTPWPRR